MVQESQNSPLQIGVNGVLVVQVMDSPWVADDASVDSASALTMCQPVAAWPLAFSTVMPVKVKVLSCGPDPFCISN